MGAVRSSLILNDGMSTTLKRINKAMSSVLDSFEAVQRASGQTFNTANINAARQEIGRANAAIEEMEQNYRDCNEQQNQLNKGIRAGTGAAGGLLGKVKAIAAAYLGAKGVEWVKESLALFDTQNNAEQQLKTVLKNMGAVGGAFDTLKEKAASLQKVTSFGDEALIGGAAEFATYMSDDKAIAVMMDTLANYAAGMSGGGEVGYKEMVDYATGLGKIVNGSYDAMTKKGFTFTDQQKKIIENGTDMEKALVISDVVNESWGKLSEQMANTPQGKIIQMKNAFGDMREELASRIYPTIMRLFDTITRNSKKLKGMIVGLARPLNFIVDILSKIVEGCAKVYDFVSNNWSWIAPIIGGIVAALIAYKTALAIVNAVEFIGAVAKVAFAGATAEEAATTTTATAAQVSLNAAILACPITWIIAAIVLLIVLFVIFTEEIMGAIWWLGDLFKNVGLWIANCGIAAWNVLKNVNLWFANLGLAIWAVIKNIGMWFANLGASAWAIIKNTGLWFANLGMGIWNVLKAAASNVGTAFHNAWISVQIGFWSMVNVIMQGLKKLAEFANSVLGWMGVNIDTSGLDFAANKIDELASKKDSYESISDAWAEGFNTFAYDSVSDAWNSHGYDSVSDAFNTYKIDWDDVGEGFNTFDTFQDGWGSDAYSKGAAVGAGIKDWMSDNLSLGGIMDELGLNDVGGVSDPIGYGDTLGDIADATGDTADNTSKSSEELSYLRDIAEKEAINRFTTAEIKVDMTGMTNRIDSDMDLDGVISYLTNGVAEALTTVGEGVY